MIKRIAVYVSGPIAGMPRKNQDAFNEAAALLSNAGFSVVNPLEVNPIDSELPREECLRNDLLAMMTLCSAMVLLPGWEKSRGALLEITVATQIGIEIYPSVAAFLSAMNDPYPDWAG